MKNRGTIVIIFFILVILPINIYAEILISDVGVEYESEILNKFNEDNQIELKLVIELRDESGIIVNGTKEEKREQLRQIDEWFKPRIDEVLLDYSNNSNFVILDKTSRGFAAFTSKDSFDKLAEDSRIMKIDIDKPIYPGDNEIGNESDIIAEEYESSEETIKYKQEIDFVYLKILITFIILLTLVVMWFIYYKKRGK